MLLLRCKVSVSYGMFVNDSVGSRIVVKYAYPIYYVTLHVYQKMALICTMALWFSPASTSSFIKCFILPYIHFSWLGSTLQIVFRPGLMPGAFHQPARVKDFDLAKRGRLWEGKRERERSSNPALTSWNREPISTWAHFQISTSVDFSLLGFAQSM